MYYFIVNPNSRSGKGQIIWDDLRRVLEKKHIAYKFYFTRFVGHAEKLASYVNSLGSPEEPVHLIVLGGDGTIHEVLTGIHTPESVIFGFIPTGSGNDFCRGMHIPQNPRDALDTILREDYITELDVPYLKIGKKIYNYGISTGIGYDAAVCQEVLASPLKKVLNKLHLGKLVYLFVALKQLIFIEPVSAIVTLDDTRKYKFKKMFFAAVMNQKYEGGGFMFCPKARPDDELLDIIVCDSLSKPLILLCLPLAFLGRHTMVSGIHIYRCKKAVISTNQPAAVHIDGESGGIRHSMETGLYGKKLRIII